jgi:hypothetical protein
MRRVALLLSLCRASFPLRTSPSDPSRELLLTRQAPLSPAQKSLSSTSAPTIAATSSPIRAASTSSSTCSPPPIVWKPSQPAHPRGHGDRRRQQKGRGHGRHAAARAGDFFARPGGRWPPGARPAAQRPQSTGAGRPGPGRAASARIASGAVRSKPVPSR